MNFQTIKNLNLKQKIDFIQTISLTYKKALIDYKFSVNSENEDFEIIKLVNFTLEMLDDEYKEIIQRDFLFKKEHNWWIEYYSKSNYYIKRKKAINNFSFYLFS